MFDTPMIRCGTTERSHAEVQLRAARIASGLATLGVTKGDNVAIVLANSVEFLEVTAGVALAGANPVPVNWHWKSEELGYLLSDSASTAAFVHSDFVAGGGTDGHIDPACGRQHREYARAATPPRVRDMAGRQRPDRGHHCPVCRTRDDLHLRHHRQAQRHCPRIGLRRMT